MTAAASPAEAVPGEIPAAAPAVVRRRRAMVLAWGLGVFVMALVWISGLARVTAPSGPYEEHLAVGGRLYRTGSLAAENDPGVLRPPGYPAFVAATLLVRDALAPGDGGSPLGPRRDEEVMLVAQCLVLALTAALLFAFAAMMLPPPEAACVGLVFACNPLALSLVGLHSYYLFHVLWLVVGTTHLALIARRPGPLRPFSAVVSGLLWGLASLVRPVTLVLPAFVFVLARVRRGGSWSGAALFTLLFTAGMAAVVLPYAERNRRVSGHFVLVNTQGWFALWASTERNARPGEAFLTWRGVWRRRGLAIYQQVTGDPEYDLPTFNAHIFALEAAFKREALRNLARQPGVYVRNVVANLWGFGHDTMGKWPDYFATRNDLPLRRTHVIAAVYSTGLLLLALPGVVVGLRRRWATAWTVLLVFCALACAHAFTFLNDRYTYVKLPLLAMGLAFTLAALGERAVGEGWKRVRLATALGLAAAGGSAAATLLLIAR